MPRFLSPQEVAALGLDKAGPRVLSTAEVRALGLDQEAPGAGEALGRGAAQGATLGFGDEIQGAVQAAGQKLLPDSLGGGAPAGKSIVDLYRENRDLARRENKQSEDAHPGAYLAGNVLGGAPLAIAAGGGAGTAAVLGGINGLGSSNADLTRPSAGSVGRAALDTGVGAVLGAGAAKVGDLAGKMVPRVARAVAEPVDEFAIKQGRRVLMGGASPLSVKAPLPDDAVREAFAQGAISPLGTTQSAAEVLQGARERVGDLYGKVLDALEAKGVRGPVARDIADQFVAQGQQAEANSLGTGVPELYSSLSDELGQKPVDQAGQLGLKQAEAIKRSLQEKARYDKISGDTLMEGARKDAASTVRGAVEDAVDVAGKSSNDPVTRALSDSFVPLKEQLSRLIPASDAADRGAAMAARRRMFSLSDNLMGAAKLGAGDGVGAGAGMVGNMMLRTRGTSTAAVIAKGAADKLSHLAQTNPAVLGKYGAILSGAFQRGGQDALNANMYVLGQTDPEFTELTKKLDEGSGQ